MFSLMKAKMKIALGSKIPELTAGVFKEEELSLPFLLWLILSCYFSLAFLLYKCFLWCIRNRK